MRNLLTGGRRILVGVVLAAIVVSAGLGISALASAHFGELQWKILGTSGCTTGAGLLVLGCLPALERRRVRPLPALGIAASLLGFGLLVVGMWTKTGVDPFWKTAGTLLVVAGIAANSSLLALPRLAPRFRWPLPAAVAIGIVVAGFGIVAIWDGTSNGAFWRTFGAFAVLLAALTLAIPVLQRTSRGELLQREEAAVEVRFCPSCGHRLAPGSSSCTTCGARFEVRFSSNE